MFKSDLFADNLLQDICLQTFWGWAAWSYHYFQNIYNLLNCLLVFSMVYFYRAQKEKFDT